MLTLTLTIERLIGRRIAITNLQLLITDLSQKRLSAFASRMFRWSSGMTIAVFLISWIGAVKGMISGI